MASGEPQPSTAGELQEMFRSSLRSLDGIDTDQVHIDETRLYISYRADVEIPPQEPDGGYEPQMEGVDVTGRIDVRYWEEEDTGYLQARFTHPWYFSEDDIQSVAEAVSTPASFTLVPDRNALRYRSILRDGTRPQEMQEDVTDILQAGQEAINKFSEQAIDSFFDDES